MWGWLTFSNMGVSTVDDGKRDERPAAALTPACGRGTLVFYCGSSLLAASCCRWGTSGASCIWELPAQGCTEPSSRVGIYTDTAYTRLRDDTKVRIPRSSP